MIAISNTEPVILNQINFSRTATKRDEQIVITQSRNIKIADLTIQHIPKLILSITKGSVTSINNLMIEN